MFEESEDLEEKPNDIGPDRRLTEEEELMFGQDLYETTMRLKDLEAKGLVESRPLWNKDNLQECIGIQFVDKKTGEVLFWENRKAFDALLEEMRGEINKNIN